MENKNIIILLIVIIVILAAAVGILFTQSINSKEPTKIRITSNKTLYEGDNLSIKLADLNKTPLSKEKVNITIKNSRTTICTHKTKHETTWIYYNRNKKHKHRIQTIYNRT